MILSRRLYPVLGLLILLIGFPPGAILSQTQEPDLAPVAPRLAQDLAQTPGPVSFLVILDEQPDPAAYLDRRALGRATPQERAAALYRYLTRFAASRQAGLRAWLDRQGVPYRAFYIVNALEVTGDASLVDALRRRPEVARLAANPAVRMALPKPTAPRTAVLPDIPYGIRYTKAPQVWEQGYRGQGIVIASQDTGVDWEHPALKSHYRGWDATTQSAHHAYNWFDAWGTAGREGICDPDPQVPCDDNGHGTHTVGTLVGADPDSPTGNQIGMAPEARWIGCRNMNQGMGTPASYMACFQFFLAPHPQNGDPFTDGDPSRAPHVINNSWYCPPEEGCDYDSLRQTVQAVTAAGILVVASVGNEGPACSTSRYPIGVYPESFSVGAHDGTGRIALFSNRGPVTVDGSNRLKPEISAPGVDVISAIPGGGYTNLSGTSMSAPHVAGGVALLWSAVPHLMGQLDETRQILQKSADPVPDGQCEPNGQPQVPNNTYGYGRLDMAAAVEMALHPARLTVQVALPGGAPVMGVPVRLTDRLTGYTVQALTDASGQVVFPRVYAGDYRVALAVFGVNVDQVITLTPDDEIQITLEKPHVVMLFPIYGPPVSVTSR